MADGTPKPKAPSGKKVPKWAIPVGGAVAVGLVILLLKKKGSGSENATEPGTEGLSNQSFIPVTGENVAGVGAGGGVGGGETGSGNNDTVLAELIKGDNEKSEKQEERNNKFMESIIANLGTGGGAPSTPAAGTVSAPAPETQPAAAAAAPAPAPAPPKAAPAPAPVTMHVIRCGNGCEGHEYPKGHNGKGHREVDCQTKNSKKQCVWP